MAINIDDFLSISYEDTCSTPLEQGECSRVYLKLNIKAIRDGALKEIYKQAGAYASHLLLTIASYMNSSGECYPTQRQISEISGMSLSTVNINMKKLMDVRIDGKPIIDRRLIGTGRRVSTVYSIRTIGHSAAEEAPNDGTDKRMNSKDVINLFCREYHAKYGVYYNVNWGRDGKLIKTKLLLNFTDEQIRTMIEISVRNYDDKWAKPKFPRPSFSMICGWLGNQALAYEKQLIEGEKEFKELLAMTQNAEEDAYDVISRL